MDEIVRPVGRWIMKQTWHHLLFSSWPIHASRLQLPPSLEVDTWGDTAWMSAVCFYVNSLKVPGFPEVTIPALQLNLRTYVLHEGVPGVYFFTLYTSQPFLAKTARTLFYLPYVSSTITCKDNLDTFSFTSRGASFHASYKKAVCCSKSVPGSIDHWIVERYRSFTHHKNRIYYEDLFHKPWEITRCDAEVISPMLQKPRSLLYAKQQTAWIKPMKKYGGTKIETNGAAQEAWFR